MNSSNDEYAFVIKPSKFAHSDGRLDISNTTTTTMTMNNNNHLLDEQTKMNSCSALIQQNCDYSMMKLKNLTLNHSAYAQENWYYGLLSREDAEKYLKFYGSEKGDFLIRDSERRVRKYFEIFYDYSLLF